ncbi:MAG: hypothetical protein JNG88_04735, partial [Phycisphaerales bacterium]|nr:hypothetical protein [Phycisphaerales bacterium]
MQPLNVATAAPYSPEPYVLDYVHIAIDVDSFSRVAVGDVLTIQTPGGQTFAALVERVDHRGPMRLSAGGTFADDPEARFNLVLQEDVIVGSIDTPFSGRMMQLRHLAEGQGVLMSIDQSAMGGCG